MKLPKIHGYIIRSLHHNDPITPQLALFSEGREKKLKIMTLAKHPKLDKNSLKQAHKTVQFSTIFARHSQTYKKVVRYLNKSLASLNCTLLPLIQVHAHIYVAEAKVHALK